MWDTVSHPAYASRCWFFERGPAPEQSLLLALVQVLVHPSPRGYRPSESGERHTLGAPAPGVFPCMLRHVRIHQKNMPLWQLGISLSLAFWQVLVGTRVLCFCVMHFDIHPAPYMIRAPLTSQCLCQCSIVSTRVSLWVSLH